jgi:apolipoprotein N-acyltransferase
MGPEPDASLAKPSRWHNTILAAAAVASSATLFFFGTGLHPLWWFTWFAPLPVLFVASRLRAWPAFAVAALAWSIGNLNMWHYLVGVLETPVLMVLIFVIVPGCIFGLVVLLFRRFIRRGAPWRAALAFPAAWVTCEYVNYVSSPHGTFPNLGYTQMDCLHVVQIVSLVGIWGISFCLFLLPATIAAVLSQQQSSAARTQLAAVVMALLAGVFLFGAWRLTFTPPVEHSVTVALLGTDAGGRFPGLFPQDDKSALELLHRYADQVNRLAARDAQVIILPEKIARLSDEGTAKLDSLFQETAERARAHIVVGLDRGTKISRFNEARVYSPQGMIATVYIKHHLLPVFEDVDRPGTELTVLPEECGVWGIQICKDMDFPALSRQYGAAGVGLLLVPAWDFKVDGWLHGRMAIMRGVESGFAIARIAKQGQLTVSDDRGRVLGEESSSSAPFSLLVVTAPVRHDDTLYARFGDYFAWANIAGLFILLVRPMPKAKAPSCTRQNSVS